MTSGDPVLLLPGILCDADLWHEQIAALQGSVACAVPPLAAATISEMADDVLRDAPPRFALAGLSMGGYVALAMMRKAPRRITRLFLANTSARADTAEQTAARHAAIAQVEAGRFDRVVERLRGVLIDPARQGDALMLHRIEAMLHRVGPKAFVRQQLATAGRPDRRSELCRIAVPTHVVGGESDRVIPPDHAVEIARQIPSARLTVLQQCGHLSPIERPSSITAALRQWITS